MKIQSRRLVVIALLTFALSACSQSTVGVDPEFGQVRSPDGTISEVGGSEVTMGTDTSKDKESPDTSTLTPDVPDVSLDGTSEGEFGTPCEDGDDCNSGYCVQSSEGTVCSKTCESDCPSGWGCKQVLIGGDAAFICLPDFLTLCMPCDENADCQVPGSDSDDRCVPTDGKGSFCGGDCTVASCPTGYSCKDTVDVQGEATSQCVKDEGECACSKLAVSKKATTSCAVSNAFGACPSMRQCTEAGLTECDGTVAGPDVCDLVDNDCDPSTPDGSGDETFGKGCDSPEDPDNCQDDVMACEEGKWVCKNNTGETLEICDGLDNDCNEFTADGSQDPQFNKPCDGEDVDLCADGLYLCVDGALSCTDSPTSQKDLCDGIDNDCDESTPDGAHEQGFGEPCDGEDADLCAEGTMVCENGQMVCSDASDDNQELCDGDDNDCNPITPDGLQDPSIGDSCDGDDTDLCATGTLSCSEGQLVCSDSAESEIEVCDGEDNDCNPNTPDGFDEPTLGNPCDGEIDADKCEEGAVVCQGGELFCDDENLENPDVCDGVDNDCNPFTLDGADDVEVNVPCDGDDEDTCEDGATQCVGGQVTCVDGPDPLIDICDGIDNDCNPETVDGSGDPGLGLACDGEDLDLCKEGVNLCVDGTLVCDDPNAEDPELCDGLDNDCNEATPDGLNEPTLNDACDGDDPDMCIEGSILCIDAALTCSEEPDNDDEICDGQDNDCDGEVDEGFPNTDGIGLADCLDEDDDDDGVTDDLDCEPLNAAVFPTCNGKQCGDNGCGESCGSCNGQDACIDNQCVCQPDCNGKQCGSDGCGGTCGSCGGQSICSNNQCVCQPNCNGKQCGSDGCGGSCGGCGGQDACVNNQCVCQPNCNGKQCGSDGCGGSCGGCGGQSICSNNQCVCVPNCGGKQCGGDGCGGSCGGCGQFQQCQNNQCICPEPNYGWVGGSCRPSCGGLLGLYGQPDNGQGCCGGGGCQGAGWPKGPNGSYDCDWCCAGPPGCN